MNKKITFFVVLVAAAQPTTNSCMWDSFTAAMGNLFGKIQSINSNEDTESNSIVEQSEKKQEKQGLDENLAKWFSDKLKKIKAKNNIKEAAFRSIKEILKLSEVLKKLSPEHDSEIVEQFKQNIALNQFLIEAISMEQEHLVISFFENKALMRAAIDKNDLPEILRRCLVKALWKGCHDLIKLLIECGAQVEADDVKLLQTRYEIDPTLDSLYSDGKYFTLWTLVGRLDDNDCFLCKYKDVCNKEEITRLLVKKGEESLSTICFYNKKLKALSNIMTTTDWKLLHPIDQKKQEKISIVKRQKKERLKATSKTLGLTVTSKNLQFAQKKKIAKVVKIPVKQEGNSKTIFIKPDIKIDFTK